MVRDEGAECRIYIYLASDSRITWGSANRRWDAGRKLFTSDKSSHAFGYCGDVVFPSLDFHGGRSVVTRSAMARQVSVQFRLGKTILWLLKVTEVVQPIILLLETSKQSPTVSGILSRVIHLLSSFSTMAQTLRCVPGMMRPGC